MTNDIKNIIEQINNNKLVENINWGIHPTKLCAIPFRSKHNPLLKSNFSSGVVTVFLTLYYFILEFLLLKSLNLKLLHLFGWCFLQITQRNRLLLSQFDIE